MPTDPPSPKLAGPSAAEDLRWMQRAVQLARQGEGAVEPNPMVGCVLVREGRCVAEGYHRQFGGPHAERDALARVPSGETVEGATWYVSLEPCCHSGKTPPCTEAVLAARPARVVVAMRDPFPQVDGGGLELLRRAGIRVDVGIGEADAIELNAPYLIRLRTGLPWVIAKWAMTLDGRIASASGHSQWISSEASRAEVHRLRGRCDAVLVGGGTAAIDNPTLTARPPGPRTPVRIVVSSQGRLSPEANLVQTIDQGPVWLFTAAEPSLLEPLIDAGVEVIRLPTDADSPQTRIASVLKHCGSHGMTNVLVEGGGGLLGSLFDADAIDEYHVFIAPKIVGGAAAPGPVGGIGRRTITDSSVFDAPVMRKLGPDIYIQVRRRMPGYQSAKGPLPSIRN